MPFDRMIVLPPTDTNPKNLELAPPQSVTATRLDQLVYSPNYYIQIFQTQPFTHSEDWSYQVHRAYQLRYGSIFILLPKLEQINAKVNVKKMYTECICSHGLENDVLLIWVLFHVLIWGMCYRAFIMIIQRHFITVSLCRSKLLRGHAIILIIIVNLEGLGSLFKPPLPL